MASGIVRCAPNAVLDDVNFKGHRYFKCTMSERAGKSVLQNVTVGGRELVTFDAFSEAQHCFDRVSTT